jgi:hypothetical protein
MRGGAIFAGRAGGFLFQSVNGFRPQQPFSSGSPLHGRGFYDYVAVTAAMLAQEGPKIK